MRWQHALPFSILLKVSDGSPAMSPLKKRHIGAHAKPFFRVILRKNQNWYLLLTDEKHIEDLIEISVRGIEIRSKEYFIQCFLRKELMGRLKTKFHLIENRKDGNA